MPGGRPFIRVLPTAPWMKNGACKGMDPMLFFPMDGHASLSEPAIRVCTHCIHKAKCLHYAIEHQINDGVWGGTTGKDRIRIRRALRLANRPQDPPGLAHG